MFRIISSLVTICMIVLVGGFSAFAVDEEEPVTTILRVYTTPPGATVYIDGVRVDHVTPIEMEVDPGRHDVKVSLEGYEDRSRTLEIEEGASSKIRLLMRPTPEYAAADRASAFEGAYFHFGLSHVDLITSDILLGSSLENEELLKDNINRAGGISLSLRYIHPLQEEWFVIFDSGYLDARFRTDDIKNYNLYAVTPPEDDARLYMVRGNFDLSIGPNLIDFMLPYVGIGVHYTSLTDVNKEGWLGADNQEAFMGYVVKGGLIYHTRRHLVFCGEYSYNWSYPMEYHAWGGYLGYHF